MKNIFLKDVQIGDVIAADIYNGERRRIVLEGTVVNDKTINLLRLYNIIYVPIIGDENDSVLSNNKEQNGEVKELILSHRERMMATSEYKTFKEDYLKLTDSVNSKFTAINNGLLSAVDELCDSLIHIIKANEDNSELLNFTEVTEGTNECLYEHSVSTSFIAYLLAKWCGYSQEKAEQAAVAGLFHDIGQLKFPEYIWSKKEPLTASDKMIIRQHPYDGYMMLKNTSLNDEIKNAVLMHHEQIDGMGYPAHLRCNDISELAQIVGIAERYEFDTRETVYKKPMTPFEAVSVLDDEWFSVCNGSIAFALFNNVIDNHLGETVLLDNGISGTVMWADNLDRHHYIIELPDKTIIDTIEDNLKITKLV